PVGAYAALVDADINFKRLGGSQKAGLVLNSVQGNDPQKAFVWLQKNLGDSIDLVEGKLKLGISIYGLNMQVPRLNANALSLKKALKLKGQSVRVVPNTELELSSAQTYHNNLTDERGCEIMIIKDGSTMLIARATDVQGIDAYRKRDQERPHRDTFIGMLPPKLAQTIVNLASFTLDEDRSNSKKEAVSKNLLDPFCGTGVVLQEASLMGYQLYGTDLNPKMVRYSEENIKWLFERYPVKTAQRYETADATDHTWQKPIDIIATEAYLGHPFASEPDKKALTETINTCNVIMRKFLRNINTQIEPGTPLCIAMPAWYVKGEVHHLPLLKTLDEIGYNRISFVYAKDADMIYRRDNQVVGRELVVLTRQ
ncbi:MAG: DNA methyltransferase, partial [Candidatus Saccharimonadales bacterium]